MSAISCRCRAYQDIDVDEFSENSPARRFTQLRQHPAPQWWLFLARCQDCQTYWLVAQEERVNDVHVVARLADSAARNILKEARWPRSFQKYAELLRICKEHGHAARFATPLEALPTCKDLVAEQPSIESEEVARLLNISQADGTELLALAKQ